MINIKKLALRGLLPPGGRKTCFGERGPDDRRDCDLDHAGRDARDAGDGGREGGDARDDCDYDVREWVCSAGTYRYATAKRMLSARGAIIGGAKVAQPTQLWKCASGGWKSHQVGGRLSFTSTPAWTRGFNVLSE